MQGAAHMGYLTDIITWAFVMANMGRVLAYLPQIVAAWRCQNGATSVSVTTWSYFAVAHLTGVLYAGLVTGDVKMALVFLGNLFTCVLLVSIVWWKKRRHQRQRLAELVTGAVSA